MTAIGLFPLVGAWSILFAPIGGSCAAVAAGMMSAGTHDHFAAEGDVDHIVDTLRSVLDDTKRAEAAGKPSAERPASAQEPTRAAG